jgi:hypothetical protein
MGAAGLTAAGGAWLLMTGIRLAFTIALIPVFFVLLALAGPVGGGLGCAVYTPADSVAWAIGVALPIFLLIMAVPLTFASGLYETFKSSAWTLAYREVAPLGSA